MKLKSIALAGGAALALATGMMGASYANTGLGVANQTQQLNRGELSRVAPSKAYQAKQIQITGATTATKQSSVNRVATNVGNKVMRAMSTKHAAFSKRDISKGVALDELRRPAQTIYTASVQTRNGDVMGEVKSVQVDANGEARTIDVATGGFLGIGERVVPIKAKTFVYLPKRDILVTNLTRKQVEALPANKPNI